MKLRTATKQVLKYLTLENGVVGSVFNEISRVQPKISEYDTVADLHCHPNINSLDDLLDTVRVCKRNNVGLCAIIQHYRGKNPHDSKEMDYWQVLDLVKDLPVKISDDELSFELKGVTFIGGYEFYGTLKGVKGHLDLVPFLPDRKFREEIKEGESVKNLTEICWKHKALVIGAHPYTVWDPWCFGKVPFRLAYENERAVIKEKLFLWVDTVDCPASNALWMLESNKLIKQDYVHPICTSDTHAKRRSVRNEIGRGGIILDKDFLKGDLRKNLRECLDWNEYKTYESYMPVLQFMGSIAL